MLKKFFLNVLSSFVGTWLTIAFFVVVAIVVSLGFITKIAMLGGGDQETLEKHSVLCIRLEGEILETEVAREVDFMQLARGNFDRPQTLRTIVQALEEGASNPDIDVLLLECNGVSASPATLHAIRQAVLNFKKEAPKKKVLAYGPQYLQGDYYVASVADTVYLNPAGAVAITGINGSVPYYKNLLDKVGVQMQVVKVGTYKSAVEPYIMEHMSEPARAQLDTLYTTMWDFIKNDIAAARGIKASELDTLANSCLAFRDVQTSVDSKLVDKVVYRRHVDQVLCKLTQRDTPEDLNILSASFVASVNSPMGSDYDAPGQVALLYATGEISEAIGAGINCDDLVPVINKLADDDNVKGMVFRVNSPGGSVYGSEQIAEAISYFQSKGKPVAVSMGDYAASGGYWISADADRIFADPLTITGSIGIFGLFPNVSQLADKLGVNFETVGTNPNGFIAMPIMPLNETQLAAAQGMVNRGYDKFVNRVAKGRDLKPDYVRGIAEGRVWSAISAKKLGLVDQLGSVADAVKWVKDKIKDQEAAVTVYPKYEPGFLDNLALGAGFSSVLQDREKFGEKISDEAYFLLYRILYRRDAQALMPKIQFN